MLQQIKKRRRRLRWKRIYEEFMDFTMVPRNTYYQNLELAHSISTIPGCVVECGVWRGGMSAGLARVLGNSRQYFLLDSFEGLPPAQEIDGEAAFRYQREREHPHYNDNCAAEAGCATRAMALAGASSFQLVRGWFSRTLPDFHPAEPIALLRLDADWYESTRVCLEHLYDRVINNGLILIDDYWTWEGCRHAVHEFLSTRPAAEAIVSTGAFAYIVRSA